jgi:hypothetical protein
LLADGERVYLCLSMGGGKRKEEEGAELLAVGGAELHTDSVSVICLCGTNIS